MVFEDFFAQSAYYFRIDSAFLWPITNNGTKQIMTCNRRFARVNAFPFVPNINHQLQLGWSQFYFGRSIENWWNLHSNSPPINALALTHSWCFPGVPQFASVVQPRALVELCLLWVVGSLYYRELSVKNRKFWILYWNAILDDLRAVTRDGNEKWRSKSGLAKMQSTNASTDFVRGFSPHLNECPWVA